MKPFFTFIFLTFLLQAFPQTDQIMFPGDMNNDGVANHYDILPLGLAIFDEGFPRELQGIHWMEHPFLTWDQVLPVTGINFGFIDSDGNGKIDTLDMDAILLNYDSVQNTSIPEPKPYIPQDTCFTCPAPTLALRFLQDTAWINEAFFAEIVYEYDDGIEVPEELGTMGFAFDLEYNPAWVKDGMKW